MISNRQIEILKILFEYKNEFCSGKFLAEQLNVSIRTIRSEMKSLNIMMIEFKAFNLLSKPSLGYKLKVFNEKEALQVINELDRKMMLVDLDTKEIRIRKIIAILLFEKKHLTLQHIADKLFLSKSVLTNDFKIARNILKKYRINVYYSHLGEILIDGSEKDIRDCIIGESIEIYYDFNDFFVMGRLSEHILKIQEVISKVFFDNQYLVSDIYLQNLILHLEVIIRRIENGFSIPLEHLKLDDTEFATEYKLAKDILESSFKIFNIPTTELYDSEITNLAIYLKTKIHYTNESYISEDIDQFIADSLLAVFNRFGINLNTNLELRISLALHLVALLTRLKYKMQLKNELLEEMQKIDQVSFDIALYFCLRIEEKFGYFIENDEVAFFAMYFSNATRFLTTMKERIDLLILSALRRSETLLLSNQIQNWFEDDISSIIIMNHFEVTDELLNRVDLICSTETENEFKGYEVINISRFPDKDDYNTLNKAIISHYFMRDFLLYFNKNLFYHGIISDKKEILNTLCDLLGKHSSCTTDIREGIFQREKMGGTYFGNGIAVPHTLHPIADQTSIVVAILENELLWDDNNNYVKIVLLVNLEKNDPRVFLVWEYIRKIIVNEELIKSLRKVKDFDSFKLLITQNFKSN